MWGCTKSEYTVNMVKEFFVIAHNIRSLHNVGSIFRTADAFGVTKIFLTGYTGTPPDSKIAKVALGAEHTVPWERQRSVKLLVGRLLLAHKGMEIIGLENNLPKAYQSKILTLDKFRPRGPITLILGEEVRGITRPLLKLCDLFVEIPMRGKKESLNVSVAFGIASYQIAKILWPEKK